MPGELERLKERVQKDPSSRLFISLADELRKAGLRVEAVQVLHDGLERQPDYMSARVALGKLYLEEDNLEAALVEFRRVADAIPDNLFAQRRLADIYLSLGDLENAKRSFEMVVRLNPMDMEAKEALEKLNGRDAPGAASPEPGAAGAMEEPGGAGTPEEPVSVEPAAGPVRGVDAGPGENPIAGESEDIRVDDASFAAAEGPAVGGGDEGESPARTGDAGEISLETGEEEAEGALQPP